MRRKSVAESKQQQQQKLRQSQLLSKCSGRSPIAQGVTKRISVYNDMVTVFFHQQLKELFQLSSMRRVRRKV